MHYFSFTSLGFIAGLALCVATNDVLDRENGRPHDFIYWQDKQNNNVDYHGLPENMRTKSAEFHHIGNDGILRVFNEAGEVIDYAHPSIDELKTMIEISPLSPEERHSMLNVWSGMDNVQISMEQIWQPPRDLLPLKLADPEAFAREVKNRKQQPARYQSSKPNPLLQREAPGRCQEVGCHKSELCWYSRCTYCLFVGASILGTCRGER
ncbi:F-box domain-containing protein [Histoplasma capsulatum G186AR]|uniref:F-box domain-containing protein n=1 Tax=Ajellomyces capsulatus TaxID=5037 RepID=A0A8H7YQT9_AJECA|nr:F-box domain-containing protein [Histoplasma capsulatum]QSS75513.1 F-box domain-containing protein [Histoplasma capsulatum G186AR]